MFELFPDIMDKPDGHAVGGSLAYCLAAFLILPFFLLFFALDIFHNDLLMSWVEIGFHGISFLLCIKLFRSYLSDCFLTAKGNPARFFLVTGLGIIACLCVYFFYIFNRHGGWISAYGVAYALPVTERNLLEYPVFLVQVNPIPVLLCMTVMVPVSVSCLYYGTAFAAGCYQKPWLGYLLVTVMIALPRFANCLMFRWYPDVELYVLASQLPIHWIACYCYEQTDSIWSPILIHSITNLLGSLTAMVFMLL